MAEFKEELVINALHIDKAEVGKKYWFADHLSSLKATVKEGTDGNLYELTGIDEESHFCFKSNNRNAWEFIYPYEARYRPYESTDEMIEDFCKRTRFEPTSMLMPVIWLKEKKSNTKRLILGFVGNAVSTNYGTDIDTWSLNELFDRFTYMDGSPVGKEGE